jgi:hypothetical protein
LALASDAPLFGDTYVPVSASLTPEQLELLLKVVLAAGAALTWLYENARTKSIERLRHRVEIAKTYGSFHKPDPEIAARLRKDIDRRLKTEYAELPEGGWTDILLPIGLMAVGCGLSWMFWFFRAGPTLSAARLLGGLFFAFMWGFGGFLGLVLGVTRWLRGGR